MIDHVVSDGNTITVTLTDGMSFDLTEAQLRNAFCWTNKKGKAMEKQNWEEVCFGEDRDGSHHDD
jgi:hypothetical protein|tara:strand:- start:1841 stop:2035 length:195 start_codon:yes stop_codon:yes gene_type:complete